MFGWSQAAEGRADRAAPRRRSRLLAITLLVLALAGCGTGTTAPAATATPRPIFISSTDTPGPPRVDASGPAVPNSTVATPFATSTPLPAASGAGVASSPTPVNQLRIQDFSFAPPTVTTTVGAKLTWTNAGPSNHTVTANDGSFDSGPIQLNGSFSFTPTQAGSYAYHCSIHPTMTGTLVVR